MKQTMEERFKEKSNLNERTVDELPNIIDFISSELALRDQELLEAIKKLKKDEHPVDCIDGVTPVETYGYEEEYNRALTDVSEVIRLNLLDNNENK